MFDWFDEPLIYYRRFPSMRSGVFDYMSRWMDSVDRAMEREFGEFFDPFFTPRASLEHKGDGKKEKKEETKEHEEKNDEEENSEPQYYCLSSSMYSGSDGVQHIYRDEVDSKTGQHKVVETKRIGDKSLTTQRVTNKDGTVDERETRKNIKDDEEAAAFKKDWEARNIPTTHKLEAPKEETKAIEHKEKEEEKQ